MPNQQVVLNLNGPDVYEAGAALLTLVAYPSETDAVALGSLHKSLCAIALNERAKRDPVWANEPQLIKPTYAMRSPDEMKRDLRTIDRRLRDRLVAGKMAIAFIQEAQTGERPSTLSEEVKRLSINEMAKFLYREAGQSYPENFESRIWRPSLPVIHVAAAILAVTRLKYGVSQPPLEFSVALLEDREVIDAVLTKAEEYEDLIAQSKQLKPVPGKLIRFRRAPA